jgi:hypothetical protein
MNPKNNDLSNLMVISRKENNTIHAEIRRHIIPYLYHKDRWQEWLGKVYDLTDKIIEKHNLSVIKLKDYKSC